MQKLTYKPSRENHGFILFPAKLGQQWEEIKEEEHLFIYSSDFAYLLDAIRSVYPMRDLETNERYDCFDCCGMNCIAKEKWSQVIEILLAKSYWDAALEAFVYKFCRWILEKQQWADEIIVEGTL